MLCTATYDLQVPSFSEGKNHMTLPHFQTVYQPSDSSCPLQPLHPSV